MMHPLRSTLEPVGEWIGKSESTSTGYVRSVKQAVPIKAAATLNAGTPGEKPGQSLGTNNQEGACLVKRTCPANAGKPLRISRASYHLIAQPC